MLDYQTQTVVDLTIILVYFQTLAKHTRATVMNAESGGPPPFVPFGQRHRDPGRGTGKRGRMYSSYEYKTKYLAN